MNLPRFSVATPCRNALSGLKRCVGSVRGQAAATVEHLIQDAASTDGTVAWLAAAKGIEGHALAAVSEPDGGMYDAIERAWSRAGGEFYSWLNADEQYLPGTLSRVAAYFDAHPEVDALFGNYIVTDPSGLAVAQRREIPLRLAYVINGFLNSASCTMFFRRSLRERGLLRFDPRYRYAADAELVLGLLDAGVRFAHVPEYLALFGIDGSNLSTLPAAQAEIEALRLRHGAFRTRWAREIVLTGRRLERAAAGAYRARDLQFRYAVDDVPHYLDRHASAIGGRYALGDTATPAVV